MINTLYLFASNLVLFFAKLRPLSQDDCNAAKDSTFFGLPVWYKYIEYKYEGAVQECQLRLDIGSNPEHIALIGFAAIEIMLRIAGLIAVGFVIYGGAQYITSQGEPDGVARAKNTIINALIGLAVAMIAAPIIAFIAKTFV